MSSIWSKLINLAGNITGTLPVANGGTGITSGTSGGILAFTASGTIASSGALTAATVTLGGGAGAAPTSLSLGTANQVLGMTNAATAHEYKTLAVGTTGSDFAVANAANSVTFNLPDAGASARGAVTTAAQTLAGAKTFSSAPVMGAGMTYSANFTIAANTADGSDSFQATLSGGGGTGGPTRGGSFQAYGNEVATFGGRVYIQSGDASTSSTTNPGVVVLNGAGTTIAQSTGAGSWLLGTRNVASYPGNRIAGCTDAGAATAGDVGEYIEALQTSATNFPTTTQYGDLGSVALTAGDWDISMVVQANLNGAVCTTWEMGIGTATGNAGTGLVTGVNDINVQPPTAAAQVGASVPCFRVNISSSATYYGKVNATYTGGPPQYRGRISARRVR